MRCWKSKETEEEEKSIIVKDKNKNVTEEIKKVKDDDDFKEKMNTIQGIFEDSVVLEEANERTIFVTKSPLFCCVSHITDHLLLSSATAADPSTLDYFKITCVMNAAAELPDPPMRNPSTKYFKISIYDNTTADILSHLDYTSDTIHKESVNNGRVLVHCVAGISRSATICIAYLMKYEKRNLFEAYKHVKARRPIIKPNCGFFRQLIAYEKSLFGTNTVKMVYNDTVKMEIPDVYNDDYKNIMHFRRKRRNDMVRRH